MWHGHLARAFFTGNARRGRPCHEYFNSLLAKIHRTRDIHQQIPAYERLKRLFEFFRKWEILSLNTAAADMFDQLRRRKVRIGSQDLKIAAIALAHDALLLSANLRDFQQVPDLRVENWLVP